MKSPAAKLDAEWRSRLAASGFEDLEGTDRDAPLSNGGRFHDRGNSTNDAGEQYILVPGQQDALAERIEHGSEYTSWAQDVARRLAGHHAAARKRRRIWERHLNGESMKEIGRTPGLNFHVARKTVKSIEEKYGKCHEQDSHPRRLARELEPATRIQVAALLLSALLTGTSSG